MAVVLEELAALGVQAFVGAGTAGALAGHLEPGDVVLYSAALRDDRTSHHDAAVGPTWTTDAPDRETAEEIVPYRRAGILTVDMEAAALSAVASFLGSAASVLRVLDVLHGPAGQPDLGKRPVDE